MAGGTALNNDRVRIAPEFTVFLPEFCRSVSHTDRAFIRLLEFLDSESRLPELSRNLSVLAPDPVLRENFRGII